MDKKQSTASYILKSEDIQDELAQNDFELQILTNNIEAGIIKCELTNNLPAKFVNDGFLRIIGYTKNQFKVEGNNCISNIIHPDDIAKFNANIFKDTQLNENIIGEYRLIRRDRTYIWVLSKGMKVLNSLMQIEYHGVLTDITALKNIEIELKYKSERDLLSGMYNKMTTKEKITEYLSSERAKSTRSALFIIDIDKFKQINDYFGHVFGDAVLSQVSEKVKDLFSDCDIIGRVGGDEFIIFMKNISSIHTAQAKAASLCKSLYETYSVSNAQNSVSASIGIAICPDHGTSYEELYKNADFALYASKNEGRNRYTFYNKCMNRENAQTPVMGHRFFTKGI